MGRVSLRIDLPDGRLGPGKIALLEAVAATGSISAAGRALGMSYRRAWLLVDDLNTIFHQPLVASRTGGRSGGGATLTDLGAEVVSRYRAIERSTEAAVERLLGDLRLPGMVDPSAAEGN